MAKINAIRGMNDILPQDTPLWRFLETAIRELMSGYGFQEIRLPIVEQTELFKRSIGEVTDIVEKEMYSFDDRNGESLTLRPEGTAGCVRAAEQHGLLYNQQQRLWYYGPMFRYEKPQKGRYRQFHQLGVEVFGWQGPDVDAELILLTAALWRRLGISQAVSLELNSLGSAEARAKYREDLVAYLSRFESELDADSQRRLHTNPLRILDSKDSNTQEILQSAPRFDDYIDAESARHFAELRQILDAAGVTYRINPRLVRGLDYYCKTVFEWVTQELGAQGTVCGGGRYDGLVEQLGGKPTPAVGFAMGIERLVLMLQTLQRQPPDLGKIADVYVAASGAGAQIEALVLAEELRSHLTGCKVVTHCGGGSFKSQLKKADKSGADLALIIGEDEILHQQVTLKPLRGGEQRQVTRQGLLAEVEALLSGKD